MRPGGSQNLVRGRELTSQLQHSMIRYNLEGGGTNSPWDSCEGFREDELGLEEMRGRLRRKGTWAEERGVHDMSGVRLGL